MQDCRDGVGCANDTTYLEFDVWVATTEVFFSTDDLEHKQQAHTSFHPLYPFTMVSDDMHLTDVRLFQCAVSPVAR